MAVTTMADSVKIEDKECRSRYLKLHKRAELYLIPVRSNSWLVCEISGKYNVSTMKVRNAQAG